MSPTYQPIPSFSDDWEKLTSQQRKLFLVSVAKLVADLGTHDIFRQP